jgi:DNA topoisomerase 2-associated protein PAT1
MRKLCSRGTLLNELLGLSLIEPILREARHAATVDTLWDCLRVMVPLETRCVVFLFNLPSEFMAYFGSNPHPFISLLMPLKGKRMLHRVMNFFDTSRNLTIVTLLVACFSQLDVVRDSHLIDRLEDMPARKEALAQSDAFVHMQSQYVMNVVGKCSLRIVSGLLGLFLERNDVVALAQTPVSCEVLLAPAAS